ncbi:MULTISPECIES: HNH endonuclease [unclassified Lysinibacillus]|uniref:HNH endonuclease n=1 Tax=unclassified Lysinibacillus TaxID=2636778 RepID=UPI00380493B3
MAKLDNRRINFVLNLPIEVKAKVLYEYLVKGTSNRECEKKIKGLNEEDGWQAWSVIHFYGFDKEHKKKYKYTQKFITEKLNELNETDIADLYLNKEASIIDEDDSEEVMNETDGNDVFRTVKKRVGQNKLRKILLKNYNGCALCNIKDKNLLITSHIIGWNDENTTKEDRVNPQNAILLCKLHDAMFENGIISLKDDFTVLYKDGYEFDDQSIDKNLNFSKPSKDSPAPKFLKEHRKRYRF